MTQKTINLGTADQGNGDPIRVAFGKVNDNFTELYTALGLNVGGLNLGAFEFTGSVMTTTDSSAIVIDQATTITSNLSVGGDVLPSVANGGDLGSSTLPWRSLYVSNNTIYIGGTAVGLDANGNLTTGGTALTSDRLVNGDYELVVETDGIISSVAFPERDGGKIYLSGVEFGAIPSDPADTFPYPLVLTSQQGNVRITSNAIQAPRLDWVFDTNGSLQIPGDIKSNSNINIEINLADSTLRRWQFGEDGNLTFPDGTNYAGKDITLPQTTNGVPNKVSWNFSDIAVGSTTTSLEWNLLSSTFSEFLIGTSSAATPFYFNFDGTGQTLGTIDNGGIFGGGKLTFGSTAGSNAGDVNAIELKATNGDVYLTSTESVKITVDASDSSARVWLFDPTGNLTFPNSTIQTTAYTGIPGPYIDDAAAAVASVAVGYPYHKTGTGGQVFVRLT